MNQKQNYEILRNVMVQQQLISRGIADKRVLYAFKKIPRHLFVPNNLLNSAYEDHPLPIGEGQTISQPYIVALMTECLNLKGTEKVLEIGTGSGYQTVILAELASSVYSIERFPHLVEKAQNTIRQLGYQNIFIKAGDGTCGWQEHSPYDGIIVTAGSPSVPQPLIAQLRNGGRLVIPVGSKFSQTLTVVEKIDNELRTTSICDCVFVPLVGKYGWSNND